MGNQRFYKYIDNEGKKQCGVSLVDTPNNFAVKPKKGKRKEPWGEYVGNILV